jgi:hypothetical protein
MLMMSCNTNQVLNVETKQILRSLFNNLKQTQPKKTILATQSEDHTVTLLQDIARETLSDGFVTRDEQLTWCDLTPSSQEKLLENTVNFLGSEIALNQLISPDSPVTNYLHLAELLEKRLLKIGEGPVSNCNFIYYDERHYIHRTFTHEVIIKHDILSDHKDKDFPDLLANRAQVSNNSVN